ncbi:hypothetical protein GGR58DRAFT_502099 [Xylaria digitata]|nr:hypothetical protein GGR58DRAFT_502099 [Xylaria digitata]
MSCSLPAQEDEVGTYVEKPAIAFFIRNRLVEGHEEWETGTVWNDILHLYFTADAGYSTGPEMSLGGERAGLSTIHIIFDTEASEKKFLIVEYRAPGLENQDTIWMEAVRQLQQYLAGITSHQHRKYGVVAIGKTVRFFEWVDDKLIDFQNDGTVYHIDLQCKTVTARLEYFRDHH